MNKIYRINMTDLTVKVEPVPQAWAGLGGRALTSTIVASEVPPACHPLGPNNKLVFAPGLLSGTSAANSGRFSCGSFVVRSRTWAKMLRPSISTTPGFRVVKSVVRRKSSAFSIALASVEVATRSDSFPF